jgi:hypothetical protein
MAELLFKDSENRKKLDRELVAKRSYELVEVLKPSIPQK